MSYQRTRFFIENNKIAEKLLLQQENRYKQCSCCKGIIDLKDWDVRTYDDKLICDICFDDEHGQCDQCGEIYPYDDIITLHNAREYDYEEELCIECIKKIYLTYQKFFLYYEQPKKEDITINLWNKLYKLGILPDFPCSKCPFETKQSCIVYWGTTQEKLFGKMEDNDCYKLECKYFMEANE